MSVVDQIWLPHLRGHTLQVRPISSDDFESLYKVASDPDLWALHSEPDRYKREVFQKFFDKAAHPPAALIVLDQATGEVVGSSRYYDYRPQDSSVVIGYTFIAKKCWGGPTNRDLKKLMIDYAFEKVGTVIFHTSEGNYRSQNAIEKLGAVKSPGIIEVSGAGMRIEYRLTKAAWHARLTT